LPDGDAEQILISFQATPSFEAFGGYFDAVNPFAFWAQVARLAWSPWLAFTGAVLPTNSPQLPPGRARATLRSDDESSSSG